MTCSLKDSKSPSDKPKCNDNNLTFVQKCMVCESGSDIFSHFALSIILWNVIYKFENGNTQRRDTLSPHN